MRIVSFPKYRITPTYMKDNYLFAKYVTLKQSKSELRIDPACLFVYSNYCVTHHCYQAMALYTGTFICLVYTYSGSLHKAAICKAILSFKSCQWLAEVD